MRPRASTWPDEPGADSSHRPEFDGPWGRILRQVVIDEMRHQRDAANTELLAAMESRICMIAGFLCSTLSISLAVLGLILSSL